jgi:simple sugar transport system ATP-binding protein
MMVGRSVQLVVDKDVSKPGKASFQVENLTVLDANGQAAVDDVSFTVHDGEILGIAGVQGNGQSELAEAILGLVPAAAGTISLDGKALTGRSPRQVLDAGVGFVPEDRGHDGVVGEFTIAENLVLDLYKQAPFGRGLSIDLDQIAKNADDRIKEFDIRPAVAQHPAGKLSGGNAQKVVVARELSRPLRLLVASQPTRGVDVGAMEFIHKRIVAERDQGRPVVVVSTELDEVLALADKIAVMYRGKIVATVPPTTSRDEIGLLMAGITGEHQGNGQGNGQAGTQTDAATTTTTEEADS